MQNQERFIVPGLGVVVLLSAFLLGIPLVYSLLLALLGLAAAATFFAPHEVQVETRTAIAALGLIILLIVSTTAFWLTLVSFTAIAALQFPHRHVFQRQPVTITWLATALKDAKARRTGSAEGDGDADEETGVATGDGEGRPQAPSVVGALPGFVRVNVGGIGASALGVLVTISLFTPWVILTASYRSETASQGFTFLQVNQAFELGGDSVPQMLFILLVVLGILSMASVVLPRVAAMVMSMAGMALTFFAFIYIFAKFSEFASSEIAEASGLSASGLSIFVWPHLGFMMTMGCFTLITVLQLIPALNRSRS